MFATPRPPGAMPQEIRTRLAAVGEPVFFSAGQRILEEHGRADRFWLLRSGTVHLDLHVPTRSPVVVGSLHPGEMLGCSWLLPPSQWHLGARAVNRVGAFEFDAAGVRELCESDAEFGRAVSQYTARSVLSRLEQVRARLLELHAHGRVNSDPLGTAPEDML